MPLHLSKVAVGCASLDALRARLDARRAGDATWITTRYRPKRADALIGGSLYWIVRHRIAARQEIIGFGEEEATRRTIIRLGARLVPVRPVARRAHQGWRYLAEADAPPDLDRDAAGLAALPRELSEALAALALI
jgi:hypothetical protein